MFISGCLWQSAVSSFGRGFLDTRSPLRNCHLITFALLVSSISVYTLKEISSLLNISLGYLAYGTSENTLTLSPESQWMNVPLS